MDRTKEITNMVDNAAQQLGGSLYISRRNVPIVHMVDPFGDGIDYSVTYFATTGTWRIMSHFLLFGKYQNKVRVPTLADVQNFFAGRPYDTVEIQRCDDDDCPLYAVQPNRYCRRHKRRESLASVEAERR